MRKWSWRTIKILILEKQLSLLSIKACARRAKSQQSEQWNSLKEGGDKDRKNEKLNNTEQSEIVKIITNICQTLP